ncbi:hypothetical protein ASG52_21285 [Methylobacterium sp. Leaf456]|nr:hypothetical protein ASG52_21285 [Methylobacterium sp. Leaf456]
MMAGAGCGGVLHGALEIADGGAGAVDDRSTPILAAAIRPLMAPPLAFQWISRIGLASLEADDHKVKLQ